MSLGRIPHALVAALLLLSLPAAAHLVSTGLGPVYDGIGHFFLSLEELLPLLGVMVLGGLHGETVGRRVMFIVPPIWLASGIAGTFVTGGAPPPYVLSLFAIGAGILVTVDFRLSLVLLTNLIAMLSAALGFMTGTTLAAQTGSLQMLIGSTAALCVLAAALPALVIVASASVPWMRIAVRVSGSWIAGVGLLMLGWYVRGE